MSLSAEQIEIRKTGVGASEVSELTGTNPYRQGIDTWLRKTGRAEVANDNDETGTAREVGSVLERAIVEELYTRRTGRKIARHAVTLRHPQFPHVLATPDAFVDHPEIAGVECKLVGARMAHHWADDTIPDYVLDQVAQNMAVFDADAWDVVAVVGGTDLRIRTVYRDAEHEARVLAACELFWIRHVETDEPPEPRNPEEWRRATLARYPGATTTATVDVSNDDDAEEIAELVRWYAAGRELMRTAKEGVDALEAALVARVGPAYGIHGPWGKFLHYNRAGSVSWKELAESELGAIPESTLEKHRGRASRVARFYPFVSQVERIRTETKKNRSKRR